jgi:DNA-binding NarL/FixJ family response regulator
MKAARSNSWRDAMAVKILLVDDQQVPGLTLRHWLKKQRELEVVGEAVPGSPALALIQITGPDVVLLDVQTSPEASLKMARLIRDHYPRVPIVAIGEASGGNLRVEAAQAGAWAFFPKRRPEELPTAIRSVIDSKGKRFLDLTDRVFTRPATDSFVGRPEQTTQRRPSEPLRAAPAGPRVEPSASRVERPTAPVPPRVAPPDAPAVVEPRRPAKPAAAPVDSSGPQRPRRAAAALPGGNGKAKSYSSSGQAKGAVAWVSPSLEQVNEPPRREPRRPRKKKEDLSEESEFRGPTGLPRRSGGHR